MSVAFQKYSKIKEIKEDGNYNFYGIIFDASLPKKEESTDNYMTCIKIIDQQVNCLNNKTNLDDSLIHLFIKCPTKELLPFIHCVGDIIRVQKGIFVI
jgi:hypothetical protein